jgi:hypothetical protein
MNSLHAGVTPKTHYQFADRAGQKDIATLTIAPHYGAKHFVIDLLQTTRSMRIRKPKVNYFPMEYGEAAAHALKCTPK